MKEIKDHTGGPTSDRQAWFQFIHEDDMVAEKSVHTIREDKIFPGRIYEIQQAVTCTLTKMWIDLNKILEKNLGNEIVRRTVFKKESDAHIILDVFFLTASLFVVLLLRLTNMWIELNKILK